MLVYSSEPLEVQVPDPLSVILQDLKLVGIGYGRCELRRPWGIRFPTQRAARFHYVVAGRCWLDLPESGRTELATGDVALLPQGTAHTLSDEVGGDLIDLDAIPLESIGEKTYVMRAGGEGTPTLMACCSVGFGDPTLQPLLALMPPLLLTRPGTVDGATLAALLEAMAAEMLAQRVGTATILTRLADVVITKVLRAWVEAAADDVTTGWLAAMRDPQISRALVAIHQQPGYPWSVPGLAKVANLSRSTFSERFARLVGVAPATYLTRWRLQLASAWLRTDRITVAEAAKRLGYASEASFSRAFKRQHGIPPSTLRRAN